MSEVRKSLLASIENNEKEHKRKLNEFVNAPPGRREAIQRELSELETAHKILLDEKKEKGYRAQSDSTTRINDLKHLYNTATRTLGDYEKLMRPFLVQNEFPDFMYSAIRMIHQIMNEGRLRLNNVVRELVKVHFLIIILLFHFCVQNPEKLNENIGRSFPGFVQKHAFPSNVESENIDENADQLHINLRHTLLRNDLLAQYAKQITGNIYTLVNLQFFPVLKRLVSRILASQFGNSCRPRVLSSFARIVTKFMLGRQGKPANNRNDDELAEVEIIVDDDPTKVQDESEIEDDELTSIEVFREKVTSLIGSLKKDKIFLKAMEKDLVKRLQSVKSIEELRKIYLPEYLAPLCDEWKRKLTENKYEKLHLVWRMFSESNQAKYIQQSFPKVALDPNTDDSLFVQQLCPQAHVDPKYALITSTILATIWCAFIKHKLLKKKSSDESIQQFQLRQEEYEQLDFQYRLAKSFVTDFLHPLREEIRNGNPHINFEHKETVIASSDLLKVEDANCVLVRSHTQWVKHSDFLWRFLFPGIFTYSSSRNRRERFMNSATMNGRELHGLFAKLNTYTKSSKSTPEKEGYNIRNCLSQLQDATSQVNIASLAGNMNQEKLQNGNGMSANNHNWKGIVPIESLIEKKTVEIGLEPAKELFQNRVIIPLDLGLVNDIGLTAVLGNFVADNSFDGKFKKILYSSDSRYKNAGIDRHLQQRQQEDANSLDYQNGVENLQQNSARTMNVDQFKKHMDAFKSEMTTNLVNYNWKKDKLKLKQRLNIEKQRYWDNIKNDLLATTEALHEEAKIPFKKTPVLIIGKDYTATMKNHRSTCPSFIINYFSRFFVVILLDEYLTSQKCPKCWSQMEYVEQQKGYRLKFCKCCRPQPSKEKDGTDKDIGCFIVNRDISAPMNMFSIVLYLMLYGVRPKEFTRKAKEGTPTRTL